MKSFLGRNHWCFPKSKICSFLYWFIRLPKDPPKAIFLKKLLSVSIILEYFLIRKCLFTSDSLVCKKDISIPGGVDSTPFYANLFLYFFI